MDGDNIVYYCSTEVMERLDFQCKLNVCSLTWSYLGKEAAV